MKYATTFLLQIMVIICPDFCCSLLLAHHGHPLQWVTSHANTFHVSEWQKLDKNLVQIIIEFYFIQHQKMTAVRQSLWLRELKFKTGLSVKLVMSRKGCPSSRWQRAICSENSFKIFHTQWKRITCLSGMKPASGITKPDTLLCLAANSSFGAEEAKFNNENWRELQDNLDLESQRITCILKCLS